MQAQHLTFEGVHGYATYDNAKKRGEEIAAARVNSENDKAHYRWVVIALPSGRFAPMVIVNNTVPGGPGLFLGERNVCIAN